MGLAVPIFIWMLYSLHPFPFQISRLGSYIFLKKLTVYINILWVTLFLVYLVRTGYIYIALLIYKPLAKIFQLSLNLGIFTSSWKIADVIARHKKKSKSDPSNYRPISLLPIISKLLETIVADRLKVFLGTQTKQPSVWFSIWAYHYGSPHFAFSVLDKRTLF